MHAPGLLPPPPAQPIASAPRPPPKEKPTPVVPEFVLRQEQRIALRRKAVLEQIREVVRSLVIELGDETLIARAEEALEARGITQGQAKRPNVPRRYTTYLSQDLGATLNAHAKEKKLSPQTVITTVLQEYFERLK